jgi:hypothetical protein
MTMDETQEPVEYVGMYQTVKAMKYTGENIKAIQAWMLSTGAHFAIDPHEGDEMTVKPGDYVALTPFGYRAHEEVEFMQTYYRLPGQ